LLGREIDRLPRILGNPCRRHRRRRGTADLFAGQFQRRFLGTVARGRLSRFFLGGGLGTHLFDGGEFLLRFLVRAFGGFLFRGGLGTHLFDGGEFLLRFLVRAFGGFLFRGGLGAHLFDG